MRKKFINFGVSIIKLELPKYLAENRNKEELWFVVKFYEPYYLITIQQKRTNNDEKNIRN